MNKDQMNHIEKALGYQLSWEVKDEALMHELHHAYYCPADNSFLHTDSLLSLEEVCSLEVIPVDALAILAIFKPYYETCYQELDSSVIALIDPSSKIGRGVLIHPSTRERGRVQVTKFDNDGPSSHTTVDDMESALNKAIAAGFQNPVTHKLDTLVDNWKTY